MRAKIECALTTNTPLTIFTPNPEIIIEAQRDENFRSILNNADLLIPDGIGVIIASRLLRDPLPERITGIDTGEFILNLAAKYAIPIFLLGAKAGVAERAAAELRARYSSIKIVGTHHGYFKKSGIENNAVIKKNKRKRSANTFRLLWRANAGNMDIGKQTPSQIRKIVHSPRWGLGRVGKRCTPRAKSHSIYWTRMALENSQRAAPRRFYFKDPSFFV